VDEILSDLLEALRGGQKETVGGQLVDETRCAARVVMDEDLGVFVEDVLGSVDGLELEVDVEEGFLVGEVSKMDFHGDAMEKVEQLWTSDGLEEMVLSCKDDLEDRCIVEGRRDEKSEIGEAIRIDQVSFIDEEQDGLLTEPGSFEDAQEEALLASCWGLFAECGEDGLEKRGAFEIGEVDVDGEELSGIEVPGKDPQERSLAQARGRREEGKGALMGEVIEFGQGLDEALILEEMIQGRVLGEGMACHLEVVGEH
jgi:hypothetical protein